MNCDDCAIDAMRAAAAKVLLEKAVEIAQSLGAKALGGNERCFKILCELASQYKEQQAILERQRRPKRSLAMEWANEPEWTEEDERAAQAGGAGVAAGI